MKCEICGKNEAKGTDANEVKMCFSCMEKDATSEVIFNKRVDDWEVDEWEDEGLCGD